MAIAVPELCGASRGARLAPRPTGASYRRAFHGENCNHNSREKIRKHDRSSFKKGGVAAARSLSEIADNSKANPVLAPKSVSVILLSGGTGKRMGASIPKQYLKILGKPICTYSFATFLALPEVAEVVVVCEDSWRYIFEEAYKQSPQTPSLLFAKPGKERQDSVYNGLQKVDASSSLVAIHDSARPLVTTEYIRKCLIDASECGAAVLGVQAKATIKEVDGDLMVIRTLKRDALWEVQTPQIISPDLLRAGFELVQERGLDVTDDVSIIEALGKPVKVTSGSYRNIKVTTPSDMLVAERFLADG